MWRLTFMGALVITVLGLSSVRGADDTEGQPNRRTNELVGYVTDLSEPHWIVLTNEVGVAVDKNTSYAFQTSNGARKAGRSDIRVGIQVRIIVGKNGMATRVLIVQAR